MLTPADAYALSCTTKKMHVKFEEIGCRDKLKFPRAYCTAAYCRGTEKWTAEAALRVYDDAEITPYLTKRNLLLHFLAKTMTRDDMLELGEATNNLYAQRMVWYKKPGFFRDDVFYRLGEDEINYEIR